MKHREKDIIRVFDDFVNHLESNKTINNPFTVSDPKKNHPYSYSAEKPVFAEVTFGDVTMECEIRQGAPYNYSFSYKTDRIPSRILMRLDTGDGTHRNKAPGILLEDTQVPTPHIHKYRSDGYSVAHRIPGVDYDNEDSTKFDYQQGFDYICSELRITGHDGTPPAFNYAPDGRLVFPLENSDPNEDADFDTII